MKWEREAIANKWKQFKFESFIGKYDKQYRFLLSFLVGVSVLSVVYLLSTL